MISRIRLTGPARYRLRSAAELGLSVLETCMRRMLRGPRRPGWNRRAEAMTQLFARQVRTALAMGSVEEARRYLDTLEIVSPALSQVNIRGVQQAQVRGKWIVAKNTQPDVTMLYLHGGGYSFYPRAYTNFVASIALATRSRTFVADYRLTPEHRFPAQLEDALGAYAWLLENKASPEKLVVAGDSAGGNLALALALAAREAKTALPALIIALSPPTDFEAEIKGESSYDWIDKRALLTWADWYCDPAQRRDPRISPAGADLRGLPPIYLQAGRAEILHDSIQAFAERAKAQGADVLLESWEDMNHDFQMFGPEVPQSTEALLRLGEIIDARVRRKAQPNAFAKCVKVP